MERSKQVLMISTHGYVEAEPELGKPDTGGQVVYVLELSKCLARLGFEVDIFTRQLEDLPETEKVADKVTIRRFECGGSEFIPKEYMCDVIPEWVENAADYIEAQDKNYAFIDSHYWDAGLAGQALANRFDIPHLHTPHSLGAWKRDNMEEDIDPEDMEEKYNFSTRIREERVIYEECDGIIATTPMQEDVLEAEEYHIDTEKTYVVPPGYDDARFYPLSKPREEALKTDYDHEGTVILAVGRMAHNKGYDLLLRAMVPVVERVDDALLLLAAGSPNPDEEEAEQEQKLRNLADELGITDHVLFEEYIPDDALPDHYRMADVFALPSRYEPFGMTAVEAMACGAPTVITVESGLSEQVTWGVDAISADPFDPEAFGHAMLQVIRLPRVAQQLREHGPRRARMDFAWMGIAQRICRIIRGYRMHGKG